MDTLTSTSTTISPPPFPLSISSKNSNVQNHETNQKPCFHCSTPSKYTCPRCITPTCSLACTRTHKQLTQCSGIRNKSAYVPLKRYGWGSMMDDYCFLEDIGRKVGEVGREIVRGGFDMNVGGSRGGGRGSGSGRGRGRGRGMGMGRGGGWIQRGRGVGGKGKREMLKLRLEARNIEMELLPDGMERRRLNQSVWDQKNQTALLTIQFKFHPSTEVKSSLYSYSSSPNAAVQPFTLLIHRNDISTPLLTLTQKHIQNRTQNKPATTAVPAWISPLVTPPPEDPENFTMPTFVLAAPSDPTLLARSSALLSTLNTSISPPTPLTKPKVYHSLDPYEPLGKSLSGTQFVEFPLIEVWEEFHGVIVDKKTGGVRCTGGQEHQMQRKRRKLNPEEGVKAISALLGDYGSEDEKDEDNESPCLVGYTESGEEGEGDDNDTRIERVDEEVTFELDEDEWSDADAEGEIDFDADPSILLELMRQAKQEGKWVEDGDESDDAPGD